MGDDRHLRPVVTAGNKGLVAGAALLVLIAAVLFSVGVLAADDDPELPERGVPAAAVIEETDEFLGREITVTGRVDVLTRSAMTLGDVDLLVVSAHGADQLHLERQGFFVGDAVYATGRLQLLDADAITARLPDRVRLPSQFQGFDEQPVLLATSVTVADGEGAR